MIISDHYSHLAIMVLSRSLFVPSSTNQSSSSIVSSMDSNLEAFSYYPADGSFAALPVQAAANTNYLNEGFLSY